MNGPPDIDTALAWRGRAVRDQDGNELGTLSELYLDSETSRPAWAGVTRGRLRKTETIVPLAGVSEDGEELRLPLDGARFDDAPDIDPDVELTGEEERLLHEHYGRDWEAEPAEPMGQSSDEGGEMIRSEEEVTETVPVRREEIRLETEPAPEGRIESIEDVDERP